jgi:hypothetical protein
VFLKNQEPKPVGSGCFTAAGYRDVNRLVRILKVERVSRDIGWTARRFELDLQNRNLHSCRKGPEAEFMDMLLDVRTYSCQPGTIRKHLALYEEYGKAPQTRHLGQPLAYLTTETGNPNEYIHIWVYENAADREAKRAAMQADPDWLDYLDRSAQLGALVSQDNRLMKPVEFFDFRPPN